MQSYLRAPGTYPCIPFPAAAGGCARRINGSAQQQAWHCHRSPFAELPHQVCSEVRRYSPLCTRATDLKVAEAKPETSTSEEEAEISEEDKYLEVILPKPLGITLARGNDAAAYVVKSDPNAGNTDERIQPGDKVVKVSASFGSDVWDCRNYGQVLYAIKTRSGDVYLKLERRNGDLTPLQAQDLDEDETRFKAERAGGNYGYNTKEWQIQNYKARKEAEARRIELFEGALSKFKKGDIEGALIDFEDVISLEPRNFMGEDFSRVTQVYRVAQYNIACCYSSINQVEPGLEALRASLEAGFEQYGKIRTDSNLDTLRKSPKFEELIDKYDEPVFNVKAIRNLFNFGKKG